MIDYHTIYHKGVLIKLGEFSKMKRLSAGFEGELDVRQLGNNLMFLSELTYTSLVVGRIIKIKKGFLFDGASLCYRLRGLSHVREYKYLKAAGIHDIICRSECDLTWKQKTLVYDEALEILGMKKYERWKAYFFIRLLGSATKKVELLINARKSIEIIYI